LTLELIGPEYYMHINTLEPELHVFFSRNIKPKTGEFLVEKQEAEQGLMPTVPDEPSAYGYEAENRHMVQSFLAGKIPDENWHDGLFILQLMMSCYLSAEKGKKIRHRPSELEEYIPNVVSGTWNPAEG
jgi:predicted dehydrogenase